MYGSPSFDDDDIADRMLVIKDMLAKLGLATFKNVPSITVEDSIFDTNIQFVDVRTEEEHAVSTIPLAIYRHEYESNRERFSTKNIIVFDTVGYISAGRHTQYDSKHA
jgi:hypothetical protein